MDTKTPHSGSLCLREIARFTDDVPSLTAFYSRLLGRPPVVSENDCATFHIEGVRLFIHRNHEPIPGGPPAEDHLAFEADDPDAEAGRMIGDGYTLVCGPSEYPWGRSAYFRDPDGRLIEITKKNS